MEIFRKYQLENNLQDKIWLVSLIHDESLAETVFDFSEKAKKIIEVCMINGAQTYCNKVKMDAVGFIVDYWHHD